MVARMNSVSCHVNVNMTVKKKKSSKKKKKLSVTRHTDTAYHEGQTLRYNTPRTAGSRRWEVFLGRWQDRKTTNRMKVFHHWDLRTWWSELSAAQQLETVAVRDYFKTLNSMFTDVQLNPSFIVSFVSFFLIHRWAPLDSQAPSLCSSSA